MALATPSDAMVMGTAADDGDAAPTAAGASESPACAHCGTLWKKPEPMGAAANAHAAAAASSAAPALPATHSPATHWPKGALVHLAPSGLSRRSAAQTPSTQPRA